ncbi:hemolysin family protein [Dellaglioa carnosa]|uniref:Hemolysin family protein n=1 Tax=Dellaglioa carnosa TaxID=2995136 RepID=A0ABT4JJK8_9LACO|nr:hemolysin family protein [Dellaglioa carnosa]MCZ2490543.1 hemolysin family protein [Dellaglioa carnosa]MCZ2493621.1 hemolysin family protein [Dellaglioa carnosa]MDK1730485.1 hemolysin family protein [Dellaglioa carnosa]
MSSDPGHELLLQLLLLVILTLINAYFSAAELAVVSVNRNKIEAEAKAGDKGAIRILGILNNSTSFLSTIQISITFAGFLSSAFAATALAKYVEPLFGNAVWAHDVAVVVVTLILSYFSLVLGELYPKQLALQMPDKIARATTGPIQVIAVVFKPFNWLLSISLLTLEKITPIKFNKNDTEVISRQEIVHMIQTGEERGAIDSDEYEMMEGVISLHTKLAREVMVARTDAFMIDLQNDNDRNIDAILNQPFSRVPVYSDDKDNVVGVVHIKNLLKSAREHGFERITLRQIMQEPMFIPETMAVDDLLFEMKKTHTQLAVLLDEYGGVVGLVTIEDLIEEIVGDIDDESDSPDNTLRKINAHEYIVQGRMTLDDFNDEFNCDIHMKDADTIAGFVLTELGRIPDDNEQLQVTLDNGLILETEKMDGSRLVELKVIIPTAVSTDEPKDK